MLNVKNNYLPDFKKYLTEKAIIQEKYVAYYLKWISACYSFLDKPESSILSYDDKEQFLKHLSKNHEDS